MARQLGMQCMAGNGATADCHEQAGKIDRRPWHPRRHALTLAHFTTRHFTNNAVYHLLSALATTTDSLPTRL
jgi:hypothetical protein